MSREHESRPRRGHASADVVQARSSPGKRTLTEQLQRKGAGGGGADVQERAAEGVSGAGGALPFADQIQASFGKHGVSGIQAHVGGAAEAASADIGAEAYAMGNQVAFGSTPSLHTAAHEAAHVVQQRAGVSLKGGVGEAGDPYEQHADAVADAVVAGRSAEPILDQMTGHGSSSTGVQKKEGKDGKKAVTGKAAGRLKLARATIDHTKAVMAFGAGNQYEALKATNFNSYFRMAAMREDSFWEIAPSVMELAAANPEALTAAKADLAHGGNCGEHAQVGFDHLRATAKGEILNMADVEGLDHAFVIMGNLDSESDADLTVCDPWPTAATACLWEDHFAHTDEKKKINRRHTIVADGQNVKKVIAAGLRLTAEGQAFIQQRMSKADTDKELKKGTSGDHPWIWQHADTESRGADYEYVGPAERRP